MLRVWGLCLEWVRPLTHGRLGYAFRPTLHYSGLVVQHVVEQIHGKSKQLEWSLGVIVDFRHVINKSGGRGAS